MSSLASLSSVIADRNRTTNGFLRTTAFLVAMAASIHPAAAQTVVASDQASNYTSSAQILTLNGGTGFTGPFNQIINGGGYFLGDSTNNGFGGGTGINSSNGTSFGIYGGNGNSTTGEALQRTLTNALVTGSTLSFGFDNGFIDNGSTDQIAIGSAASNNLITFGFLGGGSNYVINGSATSLGYTSDGVLVSLKFTSATAYTLNATALNNNTTITFFGTVPAASTLNTITVSNNMNHGGSNNDLFVNKFQVTSAPEPDGLMLAAFGGMFAAAAWVRRRRTAL